MCRGLTQEGESRASTGSYAFSDGGAKAYMYAIQNRLEEYVIQDNASYRALIKKKFNGDPKRRRTQKRKDAVAGPWHIPQRRRPFGIFLTCMVVIVIVIVVVAIIVVVVVVVVVVVILIILFLVVVVVVANVVVVVVNSNSGNAIDSSKGNTRTSHNKEQTISGKGKKRVQKRMMEAAMLMQSQEYM